MIVRTPPIKNDQFSPHEAQSNIISNHFAKTCEQAALFAVCHSSAWDNHLAIQAYWVHSHQV